VAADELILALDLYYRHNPLRISKSHSEVVALSKTLCQPDVARRSEDPLTARTLGPAALAALALGGASDAAKPQPSRAGIDDRHRGATSSPTRRCWRAAFVPVRASQGGGGTGLSQVRPGFLDAVAAAFLLRRQGHQRLRSATVRGLTGVGGALRIDSDQRESAVTSLVGGARSVPSMSIVIMVVGSRGDVQPFLPIARLLAKQHRVRLATHREFRSMIEHAGLEFYPLAGDPHALMEYIVKTGGRILPRRLDQLVEDVPKHRAMIAEILASTWRACTEPDPERPDAPPFRADVILANPPSYGHIHCAEALHVPLHMIFTMPWSATSAVPHPFAGIDPGVRGPVQNFLSYGMVDLLIRSGIADLVNAFRKELLGLPPLSLTDGAALLDDYEVPFTYLWPSRLLPKPADWGPHIDLANFTFHDQAHTYQPPRALLDFLAAGDAPIYVGFGSIVVDDPPAVSRTIFTALEKAGARGIVSEGWAHLGGDTPPPNVFLIGDCPHDWLFPRCRIVCHHGGAGTTAAGLRAGLPTVVVPFFGDQFLWGQIIADAGAGPRPIPGDRLDSDALAEAFTICLDARVRERASALGAAIRATDGVELTVQSVYRHLPLHAMSCSNDPDRLATVYCETCSEPYCTDCCHESHSGHVVRPHRYVDWSARAGHGLAREISELFVDAARALHAGLAEVVPAVGLPGFGVGSSDGGQREPSTAEPAGLHVPPASRD
jgi:UDP:flavonoid glycosyltransferase YjiC (YdhE family)